MPIVAGMEDSADQIERRVERVAFETDRQRVVGDVTLPPEGYQSRFSDSLNRRDVDFIPLVNAEVSSLVGGEVERRPFIVLCKNHVRLAFPLDLRPDSSARAEPAPDRRSGPGASAARLPLA